MLPKGYVAPGSRPYQFGGNRLAHALQGELVSSQAAVQVSRRKATVTYG